MARHLIAAAVLVALAQPAQAQDRPTVFLHGFNSSAASWAATASRLQSRLQIAASIPELPWQLPYDAQANQLQALATGAGAPPNMVLVGHSNGGLVARQLSTKRPVGGIVTLGSPHQGAPLAATIQGVTQQYALVGQKLGQLLYMLGASNGTNRFTGLWNSPGMAPVRTAITTLGVALYYTVASIEQTIYPVVTAPVLRDMTPGSPVLTSLNSAGNLAREHVAVPARVGLVFAAREWWVGAPFVAGAPQLQYSGDRAVRDGIHYLTLIANYFTPPNVLPTDLAALSIRYQAQSIISDLLVFNSSWCGATTGHYDCSVSTDGVVPTESQFFPGDAANIGYYGPAHVNEKNESENYLFDALTQRVGLVARGASSGPPVHGAPPSTLTAGERLYPDTEVRSTNGAYALRYQSDGNLVLYGPSGAIWDSGTGGRGALYCEMQPDGNLVIYHADGSEPWASDTGGLPGAELRVQDDGYIVIYDAGNNVPWWAPQ
ncbi:MAG: hypothetical protein ABI880_10420 [Acidobacteriota bacterium]